MSPLNITQPVGIWSILATFSGDVQYTQNGTLTNPCTKSIRNTKKTNSTCSTTRRFFVAAKTASREKLPGRSGWLVEKKTLEHYWWDGTTKIH